VSYEAVTDDEALAALRTLAEREGIIAALESAHAVAAAIRLAPTLPRRTVIVVNLSGRGDKDMGTLAAHMANEESAAAGVARKAAGAAAAGASPGATAAGASPGAAVDAPVAATRARS
jgi:threonine synthase